MTTWILIWVVSGFSGYAGNEGVATGSAVFHSQASCEKAAAQFKHSWVRCLEDQMPQPEAK